MPDAVTTGQTAPPALLVLEDGTAFAGRLATHPGEVFGEVVFNTSMTGYQEVLTDPSYRGQIVVMTYPEIGIYGVNDQDVESREVQVAGYVVHHAVRAPSNCRATASLTDYLAERGVTTIEQVDTRALARHLRSCGAMRGAISSLDLDPLSLLERVRQHPSLVGRDLAREVTCGAFEVEPESDVTGLRVILVDGGAKDGIARSLEHHADGPLDVIRVPYDSTLDAVCALNPDGVIVSNGPGDPAALTPTVELVRGLLERRIPTAGICLGHQILALALGASTYKMQFGHRGSNHPVKETGTGQVMITSQNHGFAVDPTSLGIPWAPLDHAFTPQRPDVLEAWDASSDKGKTMADRLPSTRLLGESPLGFGSVEVTHLSLNDGTLEGIRLLDLPALSVQFHPEASPGPHDAASFFEDFLVIVRGHHA